MNVPAWVHDVRWNEETRFGDYDNIDVMIKDAFDADLSKFVQLIAC